MDNIPSLNQERVNEHLKMLTPDFMVHKYVDYFKSWERK